MSLVDVRLRRRIRPHRVLTHTHHRRRDSRTSAPVTAEPPCATIAESIDQRSLRHHVFGAVNDVIRSMALQLRVVRDVSDRVFLYAFGAFMHLQQEKRFVFHAPLFALGVFGGSLKFSALSLRRSPLVNACNSCGLGIAVLVLYHVSSAATPESCADGSTERR
jgi:hypothetical protein